MLDPPFGLSWGDSPEPLIEWADRHALDIRISLPGDQPDLRIVRIGNEERTLPSSKARVVEASFLQGRLYELTVHYGGGKDGIDLTERRFAQLKRQLTTEYGELVANRQERSVEDDFATRTLSFHREPVKGLFLLLAYTEMEDLLRKEREARFSLIYRNDNLRDRIRASSGSGP